MKERCTLGLTGAVVAVVVMGLSPVAAGFDVSFGADVAVDDDTRLFFSISSRYFDRDVRTIESYSQRYFPDPDDLSVALFLSSRCDKNPDWFFSLRKQGLGWFEIGDRCDVPLDVWFVPVSRDPGPPYGKAYGHWKKHKQRPDSSVVLSDDDCRNLVALRVAHEYYGVSVETAMNWRSSGASMDRLMTTEYRKRHRKSAKPSGQASSGNNKGAEKSKNGGKDK